ncbi:hypothetical protein H310_07206 [Aphanomyces invadans]|uniref:Uncharacterized protein n=1 Tax=Aphanomyces invadans TaxID=157072 RepID=A0A024U405_9STRA|nr:hypothetical protein H310_07206 [Aphanomyces invadans]ETW00637.1 hypothetical protein H310_07206 [Aphanomyces invadans]|eukprot:XP_008870772.1 hypothetical protein H310_07206 [Aphanomyces invadans]
MRGHKVDLSNRCDATRRSQRGFYQSKCCWSTSEFQVRVLRAVRRAECHDGDDGECYVGMRRRGGLSGMQPLRLGVANVYSAKREKQQDCVMWFYGSSSCNVD